MLKNIYFIGWQDVRFQLRDGSTLLWLLVMPPIFFFFIGTVTGGFAAGISGGQATPIKIVAENPGFVRDQVDLRLRENDFAPEWVETLEKSEESSSPARILTFDAGMSNSLVANEPVSAVFAERFLDRPHVAWGGAPVAAPGPTPPRCPGTR